MGAKRTKAGLFVVMLTVGLTFLVSCPGALAQGEEARCEDLPVDKRPGQGVVEVAGVKQRLLVRFRKEVDLDSLGETLSRAGVRTVLERIASKEGTKGFVMDIRPDVNLREAMDLLRRLPDVLDVEPDQLLSFMETPAEPDFPKQWGLHNTGQSIEGVAGAPDADIDACEAWDIERGNTYPVVVAVIDSGIDDKHPDLDGNIWRNPGETKVDGVDEDGNGFTDDLKGFNWVGITQPLYNDTPWELGNSSSSQTYAQSLKGTGQYLTHVGIVLAKYGSPSADVVVSVRRELAGSDLARMTIRPSEVSAYYEGLIYKRLNTPVKLQDGTTYYLVIRTAQNSASHYYLLYDLWDDYDCYCDGCEWKYDGSTWRSFSYDLCFVTNPNGMPRDDHGHGTHCAGIVGAEKNGEGIIGVSRGAKIMPLKAGCCAGWLYTSDIVSAIYYAADNGADVISMSFGGTGYSSAMRDALAYARDKGVALFAAAGNSGDSTVSYPAGYEGVIGVGATTNSDTVAYFSTRNSTVDISAPGVNIYSTLPTYRVAFNSEYDMSTAYDFCSGTSMATPMAAGVAALILSRNPKYTPAQVENALKSNADDLGAPGRDDSYGYGRVNAHRALQGVPPLPFVRSVTPAGGMAGTTVTLKGKGFGSTRGNSSVYFGTAAAVSYLKWTDGEIQCKVPVGAAGVVNLYVSTGVGKSNKVPFKVVPKITEVAPSSGSPGTVVTVKGAGFGGKRGTSYVRIGAANVTNYVSWSNTAIQCVIPYTGPGAVTVTVTTSGGTSNKVNFTIV